MATTLVSTNSGARLVASGDQLVVARSGTVIAANDGTASITYNSDARIIIEGGVYGNSDSAIEQFSGGTGTAHIVIGPTGSVIATALFQAAIRWGISASVVENAGFIGGSRGLFSNGGKLDLVNTGTISTNDAAILVIRSTLTLEGSSLVNLGTISTSGNASAAVELQSNAAVTVFNSGTIASDAPTVLDLGFSGSALLVNEGLIAGGASSVAVTTSDGADTVSNRGTITGPSIFLNGGDDIYDGATGHFQGRLDLGLGNDTAFGGVQRERIDGNQGNDLADGGEGDDTINGGADFDTLYGSDGNDSIVGGTGLGNDVLIGGDGDDTLLGGAGADEIVAGAGDDIVEGGAGADLLDGGDGSADMLSYAASVAAVTVSLARGEAFGGDAEGDVFQGFEGVRGGNAADSITGSAQANLLRGAFGNDTILGDAGNDRITGDAGDDRLVGGAGQDLLWGGTGVDRFVFVLPSESGPTGTTRDWIMDFSQALDERIDLAQIDANAAIGGNQDFTFIGSAAFSGAAGELRSTRFAAVTLVQGDVNGDAVADLSIMLRGAWTLGASDFILGLGLG